MIIRDGTTKLAETGQVFRFADDAEDQEKIDYVLAECNHPDAWPELALIDTLGE